MRKLASRVARRHIQEDAVGFAREIRISFEHKSKERIMSANFTPVTSLQPRNKWRKKIVYAGIFLDPTTKANLMRWWDQQAETEELFDKKLIHHITLAFKPTQEEVEALPLGKPIKMRIVGYGQDDKAQAIFVEIDGLRSKNKKPHVTMAISSTGAAKNSNDLDVIPLSGVAFEGVVGYFGKGKEYKEIAWESA